MNRAIVKVGKNGSSLCITLPRPVLHALQWTKGTHLVLEEREGCLVVAEAEAVFRERALERVPDGLPALRETPA